VAQVSGFKERQMKIFYRFFFKNGKATWYGRLIGMILSLLAIYSVVHFRLNNIFGWLLFISAWIVFAIFGLSGRAEALGLKPFTSDPLGWRKAKQSYQTEESPKASVDEPPSDKP
jgi:hypothetical protein